MKGMWLKMPAGAEQLSCTFRPGDVMFDGGSEAHFSENILFCGTAMIESFSELLVSPLTDGNVLLLIMNEKAYPIR
jgi:hypothetical protein